MKKSTTIITLLLLLLYKSYSFAQCTAPTNLQSSMIGPSATFTWDAVPTATSYTVDFKYSVYSWNIIEYSETVATNSLYLSDVLQSLDLTWRVTANCGTIGSSNFTEASFSSPCALPVNLSTTNITQNSATLNWEAPAALGTNTGAYVYAYRPMGVGASWIPLGNSTNLSIPLTGLTAGVTYEWCVNQICAYYTGNPAISTFTTLPQTCGVASLWLPNQITSNQANLRWTAVPNATSYLIEYKPSSSQNWTASNSNTIEKLITNLTPSTLYDWRIKATCTTTNVGIYSGIGQFTTASAPIIVPVPVSCGVPNGLAVNNLGNKTATFSWAAVTNATSYTLQYNLATNAGWLQVSGVSETSFTRNNLQIAANYKFRVKAVCGAGSSNYSPEFTFSTLNCVSAGDNSAEWIDLFSLGTINRTSGAETGGYINTGLNTDLAIGTTGIQGQISADFASNVRNQNYSVYIDFNRNGNFNDAGERVYGIGGLLNGNIQNFTISIPSTATAGLAGLRVVMAKNGGGNHNACMDSFQGETEDYTVNLTASSYRLSAENEPITNNSAETITVYPNPSAGIFKVNIPSNFEAESLIVVDTFGKKISTKSTDNNSEIEINLNNEPAGMYFLNIQTKSGQKVIKKLWKL